jgi:AcrR family transcriptional regulator
MTVGIGSEFMKNSEKASESPSPVRSAGRPRSGAAQSHQAVMDAVFAFLQQKSVRELTMEGIAEQAKVGKPTLYKWWPTKAALVMALFHERLGAAPEPISAKTAEATIREIMHRVVRAFNGMFGKVMADLIAEGQHDLAILQELYQNHLKLRRDVVVAAVDHGKDTGELLPGVDSELLVDSLFGPIYYRLLVKSAPLTEEYVDRLLAQVMKGQRSPPAS